MATNDLQLGGALANPSRRGVLGILVGGTVAVSSATGASQRSNSSFSTFLAGANPDALSKDLTMNMHTAITQSAASSPFNPSMAFADRLAQYRSAKAVEDAAKTDEDYHAATECTNRAMTKLINTISPSIAAVAEKLMIVRDEFAGTVPEDEAAALLADLLSLANQTRIQTH